MSELAKFVAATLEEGVAVELEEEKKQLQNEIEKLKAERAKTLEYASRNGRIEITGKGGLPVYAHGELSRANYNVFFDEHKLDLTCDPTLCPIKKVKEAEIRLNGLLVAVLSEHDGSDGLSSIGDEYFATFYEFQPSTHGIGGFWEGRKITLDMEFGPVPDSCLSTFKIDSDFRDEEIREVRFADFVLGSDE